MYERASICPNNLNIKLNSKKIVQKTKIQS